MINAAFRKYYFDFNLFNLVFSLINGLYFGVLSGLLIFCSFGMFIGYLGYNFFRKNEYYLYYNLGFTKKHLLKRVFLWNLGLTLPVIFILSFIL